MERDRIASRIRHAIRLGPGIAPLLGYAVLTAAMDVYTSDEAQSLSPLNLAAAAFTFTAITFIGWDVIKRGVSAVLLPWRTNLSDVIVLNASTATSWISLFYALKYLEPAIVNVAIGAIAPVMTILLGPILRKGSSVLTTEVWASIGICGFLSVLIWSSISGHSGVGRIGLSHAVLGITLMLIAGLATTVNVIYSKRLSDAQYGPRSILAARFYLIVAVSWSIIAVQGNDRLGVTVLPAIVIAVLGVGVPLYLIQLGVRHTEPITSNLVCTLSPLFAFVLQLPVQRISPSPLSFACIAGITVLVGLGTMGRVRQNRGQKVEPAGKRSSLRLGKEIPQVSLGQSKHQGRSPSPSPRTKEP